ncbi:GYF domain-containing protein [Paludibaculum fermentans]|uniref:GYF domain-containing protein n=1 Tax=Paludibaculum fermentans TaxID=1473598 RepID=UPI003EBF31B1
MNTAITTPLVLVEEEDFLIALDDLAELADSLGARANAMSLIPPGTGGQRTTEVAAAFQALSPELQVRLAVAAAILRAPAKMAHWHHTMADETVSRAALAWSTSVEDSIVALGGTVDPRRITFWTQASVQTSISKMLAAGSGLSNDEIGCKLSTPAVVVFLAVLDQMRAARLHGMLTHSAPGSTFSRDEILERLRDSASEDFRWPLLFVEKLIPGQLVTSLTDHEVASALGELMRAGWVETAAESRSPRYELTTGGKVLSDGVLHDVSKVALGVTEPQADGQLGRDIVLLIRSTYHLLLFAMAGQAGAIAALDQDELAATLHFALRPPAPPPPSVPAPPPAAAPEPLAASAPPPPLPPKAWHVIHAGQSRGPIDEATLLRMLPSLPPETLVWNQDLPNWMTASEAGLTPAETVQLCSRCGTVRVPGQRFCANCGQPQA